MNSAPSNELLKISKKREKGVILHLQIGTTDEEGDGGAENFFGDSLFYALQRTKIWSNSERCTVQS